MEETDGRSFRYIRTVHAAEPDSLLSNVSKEGLFCQMRTYIARDIAESRGKTKRHAYFRSTQALTSRKEALHSPTDYLDHLYGRNARLAAASVHFPRLTATAVAKLRRKSAGAKGEQANGPWRRS